MSKNTKVLFCNCGYSDIIDGNLKAKVLNALTSAGVEFEAVQDLCELAAKKSPKLKCWSEADSIKIAACYGRAVKWLFNVAGAPLKEGGVEFLNMRISTAEEIIDSLLSEAKPVSDKQEIRLEEKGDWVPWFPVIDYDQCENCMQCLNFCLFGVYELGAEGKVEVKKPDGCKTNCPACARVCPHKAIIFPKYTGRPINGGEVDSGEEGGEGSDLDMNELSHSDIQEMIRQRSGAKKRFAKDKDNRQQINIAKLQEQLDIPADVLASLSSEEIGRLKKKSERKQL